jgi:hypothetical protein
MQFALKCYHQSVRLLGGILETTLTLTTCQDISSLIHMMLESVFFSFVKGALQWSQRAD